MPFLIGNLSAAEWAWQCAPTTYKGITPEQREQLKLAVGDLETAYQRPGFTARTAIDLFARYFEQADAERFALTEWTRIDAYRNQVEGEELAIRYPDVKVIKLWYTNNDHHVCNICDHSKRIEVEIHEPFAEGIYLPPAHEGCRCRMSATTNIEASA